MNAVTMGAAPQPPALVKLPPAALADLDSADDFRASHASRVIWLLALFLALAFAWAWYFQIDEVSTGTGKVIPSSREQQIQSLEGGILLELRVREGDIVEKDEVLARLDPTRGESNVGESAARWRAALASQARLSAEVQGLEGVGFPSELDDYPQLRDAENALFASRRKGLAQTQAGLRQSLGLVQRELKITRELVQSGAASNVELIRLEREQADLQLRLNQVQSDYMVSSREELARASAEANTLESIIRGREFELGRTTLRSPVRGIVKRLAVTTIGGVIPPGGALMSIVPLDDQLLIEARVSPRDIAFIHPEQEAMVKVTAYDYAIYGGLVGRVVNIAPDTVRDEVRPEIVYYPVLVRTESDALVNQAGKRFPITPGMVTTVDIQTGSKSVWDYLTKPFNRAREALRER